MDCHPSVCDPEETNLPRIYAWGYQSWSVFQDRLMPKEDVLNIAKYFVFNKFGIWIKAKKLTKHTRKYVCTCTECNIASKHNSLPWSISFTRQQRTNLYKLSVNFDIETRSKHNISPRTINSPHQLANFQPFQKFIVDMCHLNTQPNRILGKNPRTSKACDLLAQFLDNNPEVKLTSNNSTSDMNANKNRLNNYSLAKRAIIKHLGVNKIKGDDPKKFASLPALAQFIADKNPFCTVALQTDSKERFFRFFLATPISDPSLRGTLTLPVFVADCTHFKEQTYDGVIFVLAAKTFSNHIVTLAFAIIPAESIEHLCWVLDMCFQAKIPLEKHALFSDEGCLLSALSLYGKHKRITFFLQICTEHFARNVLAKLPKTFPVREVIKNLMHQAARSNSLSDFHSSLEMLFSTMLEHLGDNLNGWRISCKTMVYILSRHPKTWSNFANSFTFDESVIDYYHMKWCNSFHILNDYYSLFQNSTDFDKEETVAAALKSSILKCGFQKSVHFKYNDFSRQPCPRQGICTTNYAEITAHSFKEQRARDCPPIL